MSEAFARMQLRDAVRQDDVDRAIAVMTRSFVSTQKHSIKLNLERRLRKYLTFQGDSDELLLHVLSQLTGEYWRFYYYAHDKTAPDKIEMDAEEFEMRARDLNVHQVRPFYDSMAFKQSFRYDDSRRVIIKELDQAQAF